MCFEECEVVSMWVFGAFKMCQSNCCFHVLKRKFVSTVEHGKPFEQIFSDLEPTMDGVESIINEKEYQEEQIREPGSQGAK